GINTIVADIGNFRRKARYWFEDNELTSYSIPYNKSYAIIVAIDDYDRKKQPGVKPTKLPPLEHMVGSAKGLAIAIQHLGFPESNIIELYDTNATSTKITATLEQFWQGNERSDCDRLFFYFGGHGETNLNSSFLVTYDYDSKRPTSTSLAMRDFRDKHFD